MHTGLLLMSWGTLLIYLTAIGNIVIRKVMFLCRYNDMQFLFSNQLQASIVGRADSVK